ncbi:MAG: RHS repeat-associated core domain-containing protein [Pseudomonadota bacterium]|nr:RHS repeat-associated core domain-containing protein [Pseudomonadota bacterium]
MTTLLSMMAGVALAYAPGVADLPQQRQGFDPSHAQLASGNESIDLFGGGVNLANTDLCLPGGFGLDLCVAREYSSKVSDEQLERLDSSWAGLGWTILPGGRVAYDDESMDGTHFRIRLPGGPEQLAYRLVDTSESGWEGIFAWHTENSSLVPRFGQDYSDWLAGVSTDSLWRAGLPGQGTTETAVYVTKDFSYLYHGDGDELYALTASGVRYTFDLADTQADGWSYGVAVENAYGDSYTLTYDACATTDLAGALSQVTDATGRTLAFGVDADCELTSASFGAGAFTYVVTDGELQQVTDAAGLVTTYSYDGDYDELTGIVLPTGGTVAYVYGTAEVLLDTYEYTYVDEYTALTGEDVEYSRYVTSKTQDDGDGNVAVWEFEYDDYTDGAPRFGVGSAAQAWRATSVHMPDGSVVDHYYGSMCFEYEYDVVTDEYGSSYYEADYEHMDAACDSAWVGLPLATLWYADAADTVPLRFEYTYYGSDPQVYFVNDLGTQADPYWTYGGLNSLSLGDAVDTNPYDGVSSAARRILPVYSVSGPGESWSSIDVVTTPNDFPAESTVTWFGYVDDGAYDIYGNALFPWRSGYAPQYSATELYVLDGTRTTYAWESDAGVLEWNLVHAPATVEMGYPTSDGTDLSVVSTSTAITYSSDAGEQGWVTRVDTQALGDFEDSDGTTQVNPSPDRWVTYDYSRNVSAGEVDVTIDLGGLRTERRTTRFGRFTELVGVEADGTEATLMTADVDDYARVNSATDANGQITTFTYDDAGRMLSVTPPLGAATTIAYDTASYPHTVTQVTGSSETTWTFDGLGRLTRTVSPNGTGAWSYTDVEYDAMGRASRTYLPHDGTAGAYVEPTYDGLGRVTASVRTDGTVTTTTTTAYDGWTSTFVDGEGNTTVRTADGLGRLALLDAPAGVDTVSYSMFASRGDTVLVNDSTGARVGSQSSVYDGGGELWWISDPQSGTRTTVRDEAGDVTCEYDDNGDYVVTTYDHRGRPATTRDDTSCTGTAAARVTYRYDGEAMPEAGARRFRPTNAQGQLTGVLDEAGGQQFSYDALGRMLAWRRWWTDGHRVAVGYDYDEEGNLAEIALGGRVAVRSTYGPGGRIEAVEVDIAGTTVDVLSDVTYHPDGTWSELDYGNGVTLTREVDGLLRTSSVTVGGSTDDVSYGLTYDANDNVLTHEDLDGADTFAYDDLDRLTTVAYGDDGTEQTFAYDESGNLTDVGGDYATFSGYTYTYNREDTHGYDAVGNLTDDGVSSFVYDARSRMTAALSSTTAVQTTYDAAGRRVLREVTDLRTRRTDTTYYVYDGRGLLLATYGTVGGRAPPRLKAVYVYAGHLPVAVVRADRGNAVYWLHTDALGSVRQNSDAAGSVGGAVEYLAYGSERARTGALLAWQDQAWAGHGGFDALGVADFGARSYLEDLPGFVTPDRVDWGSAESPQSLNRYAYGAGNPYRYVDPSGAIIETAWDIANLAMDVGSLAMNLSAGNWGGAALDAVGLIVDGAATVVPGMPGGAGSAIKAYRAADKVADVASGVWHAEKAFDVAELGVDAGKAAKAVHGNSKAAKRAQHGYEITDSVNGKVVKTGVSGGARTAAGGSVRANRQARRWNRKAGHPGRYQAKVVKEVPGGAGAREEILEWEIENAGRLRDAGQLKDPLKHSRP